MSHSESIYVCLYFFTILIAALSLCRARMTQSRQIYDNIVQQIETMGQPYSSGGPGEGLRLVLGTAFTRTDALMVADVDTTRNQTLISRPLPTRWLLPASLTEFDPRCNVSDIDAALANNCSLLGTFDSCTTGRYLLRTFLSFRHENLSSLPIFIVASTTGCGRDPRQEELWDALPSVIQGVRKSDWTVAGVAWEEMRGILQGILEKDKGVYGPVDLLQFMESASPMTDRQPFGKNQNPNCRMKGYSNV